MNAQKILIGRNDNLERRCSLVKRVIAFVLSAALLGFLAGAVARKVGPGDPPANRPGDASLQVRQEKNPSADDSSKLQSSETLESLATFPSSQLYDSLALWLVDANEPEIAEFWVRYSKRSNRTNDLTKLIFINWTLRDPEAAIAAVAGTNFAWYPWYAWTCHEPEKALGECLARFPGHEKSSPLLSVIWALGEFHQAWLREHLDDLPESWMRKRAIQAYRKSVDVEDPRESIAFKKMQRLHIGKKDLHALSRENPIEADHRADSPHSSYLSKDLVNDLLEKDPTLLEALIAETRSPEAKVPLLLKRFENHLAKDPESAQEALRDMPASWLKQDCLAALGKHYLKDDPQKAIDLTLEFLSVYEGDRNRHFTIEYGENSRSETIGRSESAKIDLLGDVVAHHPHALMDAAVAKSGTDENLIRKVGSGWAQNDLTGFSDWVLAQGDSQIRSQGIDVVANNHQGQNRYLEAMKWTESHKADVPNRGFRISNLYSYWVQIYPEEAKQWRENATVDEATEARLKQSDQLFRR